MVADALDAFHPLVAGWFRERFGAPTDPQRDGWPRIGAGHDVLIAAPTGSGKTLAAFLACMDALVRRGLADGLDDHTDILYISPLKALSNDVQRNLEAPLAELREYAAQRGVELPTIRVAVRTGDTPASERAKLAKRPPHILVTTPESLYILLTTVSGRAALSQLRTVIVDEIHAIAGDKRGAHLAISLERLDRLVTQACGRTPVRVGLSATQKPIERIGRLLVGTRRPMPHIVDSGHRRVIDLAIEITDDELGAVASLEQFGRVYDRIAELVQQHRSTIVFVNTRRLVERTAAALEQRLGEEHVVAHHGSMSRALRLAAEQKLKLGQVKCAVATASLELGIDVGTVDLVVQLGSPRSIATLLQRVGRSGHTLGATPKGRLFALTRDQLVECAALVRGVRRGNLDEIELRDAPLDILAQQIVATCAAEDIREDDLRVMLRGATQYADLDDVKLEQILEMLAEGVSDRRGRGGAHIHRDRVTGVLKGRRGARLAAITCGGAIPDNNNYAVVQWPEEIKVGEVDEDFAIDSSAGDIFQLGNTAWRIKRIEMSKVIVEDAKGQPPTIPFWFGEAPARTSELSDEVSDLRREIDVRLERDEPLDDIAAWVVAETSMPARAAQQLVAYYAASRIALGALPRNDLLVAERFFDEGGGMQLVLHSPLGGRINRAWGLALRKKFCVTFDFELQAAATDDGIVISLGQPHSFPLDTVFGYVPSHQAEETLVQALLDRPMFEIRWRWNVTRSLTVLRRKAGKKVPPHLVKMRAADTLSVVFPQAVACGENIQGPREVPDHPLVFETIRDCLVEAMDLEGLREMIERLERGEIAVMARDTVEPSPLSHELINANPYAFLDDAPLEERRTRAVQLRRGLPATISTTGTNDVGAFDIAAIAAAAEEVAPTVRDTDELHDALMALWLVPEPLARTWAPGADDWFEALTRTGRATRIRWRSPHGSFADDAVARATNTTVFGADASCTNTATGPDANTATGAAASAPGIDIAAWVATERLGAVRAILGADVECIPAIPTPSWAKVPPREEAILRITSAHLDHRGPVTAPALADELGLPIDEILGALLALEGDGAILRGSFTPSAPSGALPASALRGGTSMRAALANAHESSTLHALEWCNRRVLARIHRLTLARLRKEIEPVSAAALMRFLLRWQRVAKHTQVIGADGLARVVEQLQGFETAAGAWEREVLPARICNYDHAWLDQLCLAGHVVWARLSPRTVTVDAAEEPDVSPPPRKKPRPADPTDPYNIAELAADAACRQGLSRDEIAAAAAAALTGARTPGYGEQVIVQLVTTSALMRRASERAAYDEAANAARTAKDLDESDDDVRDALRTARETFARIATTDATETFARVAPTDEDRRIAPTDEDRRMNDVVDHEHFDPRNPRAHVGAPRNVGPSTGSDHSARDNRRANDNVDHEHFDPRNPRAHVGALRDGPSIGGGRARDDRRANDNVDHLHFDPENPHAHVGAPRDGASAARSNPPPLSPLLPGSSSEIRSDQNRSSNKSAGEFADIADALIDSAACDAAPPNENRRPNDNVDQANWNRNPAGEFADIANALIDSADARERSKPAKRAAPGRSAPLALMLRTDSPWLRAAAAVNAGEPSTLSPLATAVRDALAAHGASFLSDLASHVGTRPAEIEDALWELVGAGIATADGFASLRVLVDRKRGEVKSLFDRARDTQKALADAALPPARKWQEAIKKARTRDHLRPSHALRSLPTAAGRWSLLPAANAAAMDADASARQLLQRYGVVFRDLVQRESSLPPWRDLLVALRRLEARGEIRGGRFVSGFVGEQFALPEALEELRTVRNPAPNPCVARVAATDPLNLVGILTPGARVPAVVGNAVLFLDGHAVASVEAGQLVLRAPLPPGARVDEDLVYLPPLRPVQIAPQAALPL
ncbi:MAG: DEAD/DEAH box helicase [Kofleriaceae bacterium]